MPSCYRLCSAGRLNRRSPPASGAKHPLISPLNPARLDPNRAGPRWTDPTSGNPHISPAIPALISLSPHEAWVRRPPDHLLVWRRWWRLHSHNRLCQRHLRGKRRQKECVTQELHRSSSERSNLTNQFANCRLHLNNRKSDTRQLDRIYTPDFVCK